MDTNCFNHKGKIAQGNCKTCHKNYCINCLSLIGKLKVVCCKNCIEVIQSETKKALFRKRIIMFLTAIVGILIVLANWALPESSENLTLIIIVFIGLLVFNFVRIRQLKEALLVEDYKM